MKYETFCKLSDEALMEFVSKATYHSYVFNDQPIDGCDIDDEMKEVLSDLKADRLAALDDVFCNKKITPSDYVEAYCICSNTEKKIIKFRDRIKSVVEKKNKNINIHIEMDDDDNISVDYGWTADCQNSRKKEVERLVGECGCIACRIKSLGEFFEEEYKESREKCLEERVKMRIGDSCVTPGSDDEERKSTRLIHVKNERLWISCCYDGCYGGMIVNHEDNKMEYITTYKRYHRCSTCNNLTELTADDFVV